MSKVDLTGPSHHCPSYLHLAIESLRSSFAQHSGSHLSVTDITQLSIVHERQACNSVYTRTPIWAVMQGMQGPKICREAQNL